MNEANTKIAGYDASATPSAGINPTNEILFGICIEGRKEADTASSIATTVVKDAESLSISFDNGIEEWNPMDQAGWSRGLTTAKKITVSLGGKRNYGDPGNDYVAKAAFENGQKCNSWFSIIFSNLDQLIFPCIINVSEMGGDSTAVNALTWEVQSDGRPTYVTYTSVSE